MNNEENKKSYQILLLREFLQCIALQFQSILNKYDKTLTHLKVTKP